MSFRSNLLIRLGGWLSFFCTLFVGVIFYVTINNTAPFISTDSVTTITKQNGANVLVESRGFAGTDKQEITIYRTFYNQGGIVHRVAIEGGMVINQPDDYVVLRSIVLPPHMTGAWCSSAIAYWRPALALWHHSVKLQDLCFEVPIYD